MSPDDQVGPRSEGRAGQQLRGLRLLHRGEPGRLQVGVDEVEPLTPEAALDRGPAPVEGHRLGSRHRRREGGLRGEVVRARGFHHRRRRVSRLTRMTSRSVKVSRQAPTVGRPARRDQRHRSDHRIGRDRGDLIVQTREPPAPAAAPPGSPRSGRRRRPRGLPLRDLLQPDQVRLVRSISLATPRPGRRSRLACEDGVDPGDRAQEGRRVRGVQSGGQVGAQVQVVGHHPEGRARPAVGIGGCRHRDRDGGDQRQHEDGPPTHRGLAVGTADHARPHPRTRLHRGGPQNAHR